MEVKTPDEVFEFAIRGNYTILYKCIQVHKHNPEVTWEQAMQLAAIEQATALAEAQQQIVELMRRLPAPSI